MKEIIRLVRYDFDNMENRDGEYSTDVKLFLEGDGLSAHGKVGQYIDQMEPEKRYLGWNGKVYPRYELISAWVD